MDFEEYSDDSLCNSDEVDSDTEVRLYGAIYHSVLSEDQLLTSATSDSGINSADSQTKPNTPEREDNSKPEETRSPMKSNSDKPLNNLFRLLDHKIDESEEEFYNDFDFDFSKDISDNRNKRKIDYIDLESSDSDVVIIDDSPQPSISRSQSKSAKKQKKSPKSGHKIDISLGNVDNLNESTLKIMNDFYDEDDYDTEEEAKSFSRMSGDRRDWKINFNDILVSQNRNNRYYGNKFICNNCNERGHIAKDCPLPKKNPICYMCGFEGHRAAKCRNILCSICLNSSHKTINCKISVNQLVCDECGGGGHQTNQCTSNWRIYHLTTNPSEELQISNLRANQRKSCYNCGAIGKHFGFECRSKSMEKRMIPVSPLMPNIRKTVYFNGKQHNNRGNGGNGNYEKVLYNEFVKNICSNELSRLSASFNKPLDQLELMETSASNSGATTTASYSDGNTGPVFNNKNKHIKWVYPETNGTVHTFGNSDGSALNDSSSIKRICQKNRMIGERVLCANSTASALNSAQTLTKTNQQINNSMQEKSQTTPQLNERSKRRKNRRKAKKFVKNSTEKSLYESFKQQNCSNFKPYDHLRRIKTNIKRFRRKKTVLL